MKQKSKTSFFMKIALCVALVLSLCGAVISFIGNDKLVAKADTIDIKDSIFLGDWGVPSSETDLRYLWINNYQGLPTSLYESYWNDHCEDNAEKNDGIDIMDYIYIDGVSLRTLVKLNQQCETSYVGTTSPLSYGGVFAPVVVITDASGIAIKVLTNFKVEFVLTIKAGFRIESGGKIYSVSEDVNFRVGATQGSITKAMNCTLTFEGCEETLTIVEGETIGELPEVPAKEGYVGFWTIDGVRIDENYVVSASSTATPIYATDITETIGLGDWGVPESESDLRYLWIRDNNSAIATSYPNEYWNDHEDNKNSNYGVDMMEYILIDGESVRSIIQANVNGTTAYKGTTFPFSSGGCYAPITLSTLSDGIRFKVMVDYKTTFNLTFKAGFTLVNTANDVLYVTENVTYKVGATAGDITKVVGYTLTFDGVSSKQIEDGQAIGELPDVPAKDGYEGVWTIDGVEITADTLYNYGENKTAVVIYKTDVTDTVGIEFSYKSEHESQFKIFINCASELSTNAWWNISDMSANLISANNGVDIMNYIYINDQNIRELSDDNRENNTYPLGNGTGWFTNSDQCRPVFVESTSEGIWVRVLHSFSGESFTVTLKAGFEVLNSDGYVTVISEDVSFSCSGTTGSVIAKKEYTLSFEGYTETLTVVGGEEIGVLPEVPAKDGYEGVWTIDGVEITADTLYNYGENKTATASYSVNITDTLVIEDRTSWGACSSGVEYYLGILDVREGNKTQDNSGNDVYYLNSTASGSWYHSNASNMITANNGVDIMEYIFINDVSARALITANVNGDQLKNGCSCWLSNAEAYPVYVETTEAAGIIIKVAYAHVGDYFEITIKSGFSLTNGFGDRVFVDEDITYKVLVIDEVQTLSKGEITDEDLMAVGGQTVTLMNGETTYLTKSTAGIILPNLDGAEDGTGVKQVLIGWTTDPTNLSTLYPVGYTLPISEEVTLYAVWLGFEMQAGASVRLSAGSSGIRFKVNLNESDYGVGTNLGLILETGTILCPTSYLVNGREFTHSALTTSTANYYVSKTADLFTTEDGVTTYATAFVNIPEKDFSRQYSARGYLKIQFTTGEGYVYTDYNQEDNSRSMYGVAIKAYNDEKRPDFKTNSTILNYLNKVLDITWDYDFAKTADALGNAVIDGDVTVSGQEVTIPFEGDIASVLINGSRLIAGSTVNVRLDNLVFSFTVSSFTTSSITFIVGPATDTYDKTSDDALCFVSSDEELDFFLNDFFARHTGVVENGERQNVNSTVAGVNAEEFYNAEWISMTYYWYNGVTGYVDENGNNEDRIAGLNSYLANVPVDDYGYVWSANDSVRDAYSEISTGEQRMGWPFPNNDTVNTAHWEFNGSDSSSWSSNISATTSGGLFSANVSGQSENVTFTSSTVWSKRIFTKYAPLLEFEVRIDDATNVDDIYVWYTTSENSTFTDDMKVSVKNLAFENYDLGSATGSFNHIIYLPMYSQTAWGESTSVYVKQLKIEIALKSDTTISGNVGLNYVRPTLDTRMSNNNSIFISALRTAYDYTGDVTFLTEQMTRARKAYNFLMQMYDATRCLKKESYLVGHGGEKSDLNWLGKATSTSIANSISQGYWDIMYMPEYDFQSNVYFQKALVDMAYLEQVMANNDGKITADEVQIKTATREGTTNTSKYSAVAGVNPKAAVTKISNYASYNLSAIQANVEESTSSGGFWDATDGRFVAGYGYSPDDDAYVVYDYGYVAWNLEAIYYGVATDEQATSIMNWLASEDDLYKYIFAPKSITVTGDASALNGEYEAKGNDWINCQFGGAIMYTSFYDLMARLQTNGADDAFARLQAIQEWYQTIYDYYVANGSDTADFYRYYYDSIGIQMQGTGTAGEIGIDDEFLESSLPIASVAYGFFGIDSVDGKTLEIAPQLPSELTYWKMENLAFNYFKYDLKIYKNAIQLSNVEALKTGLSTDGLTINVVLDYEDGQSVYLNGVKLDSSAYTVEDGKVTVEVSFGAVVVEVK